MAAPASELEALAAALLGARRAVVLTGLRLGGPERLDLTHANGEWARRASLEAFLTEPARFWEYFYPTALAIAARQPGPGHEALALKRDGRAERIRGPDQGADVAWIGDVPEREGGRARRRARGGSGAGAARPARHR